MAGTVVIGTLSDGTNSTSATNPIRGSAKAWVNFNGSGTVSTNQSIRASYNVGSVFKNASGNYTINFTSALADSNYAAASMGTDGTGGSAGADAKQFEYRTATTTTFNLVYARQYSPYTLSDCTTGCVEIFGN